MEQQDIIQVLANIASEREKTKREQEKTKREIEQEKTKREQEKTKQIDIVERQKTRRAELEFQSDNKRYKLDSTTYASYYSRIKPFETIVLPGSLWKPKTLNYDFPSQTSTNEVFVQETFGEIFKVLEVDSSLKVHDTHSKNWLKGEEEQLLSPDFAITLRKFEIDLKDKNIGPLLSKIVIGVGDVKAPHVNIETDTMLGQITFYMRTILELHQTRRYAIYGFLSNYNSIILLRADRNMDGRTIQITRTKSLLFAPTDGSQSTIGLDMLSGLLNMKSDELDSINAIIEPNESMALRKFLGEGLTSCVFQNRDNQAVKVCQEEKFLACFENEARILEHLHAHLGEYSANIPKMIHHSRGYITLGILAPLEVLTKEKGLILIDLLKKLHSLSFGHRDIRPDNILLDSIGRPVLIDWGFAHKLNEECVFAGTITFCANDYLREKQNRTISLREYKAVYDCESLLKTFCFLKDDDKSVYQFTGTDEERFRQSYNFWHDYDRYSKETGPDSTCAIKDKNIACWGGLMYISPTSIPGGNANFTQIVSGGGASAGGSYMLDTWILAEGFVGAKIGS